jgi:hypothetical protein
VEGTANIKRIGLAVAAWVAVVLSFYAVFVILNTWFLVPNNPYLTQSQNIKVKLEIIAVSAVALFTFIKFAEWSFRKRKAVGNSN